MPQSNIPEQARKLLPESWQKMGDTLGEEFWDFLGGENVEALGDAMEQAERGVPPVGVGVPVKYGMTWLGVGAHKVPQMVKFLRGLRKQAKTPGIARIPKMKGIGMPKGSATQDAAQAYFETRQTPTAKNIEGIHTAHPGKNEGEYAGLYSPIKKKTPGGPRGAIGVYEEGVGGRSLPEEIGTLAHEGLHSVDDARMARKGDSFSKWYHSKKNPGKKVAEEKAVSAGTSARRDLAGFIRQGKKERKNFPEEERSIFDAFSDMYTQTLEKKKLEKAGRDTEGVMGDIEASWDRLRGGPPTAPPISGRATSGAGELSKPMAQAADAKVGQFAPGTFIDINGVEHKMRNTDDHLDKILELKNAGKEHRGYNVRSGQVYVPEGQPLEGRAFKKAVRRAAEMDIKRNKRLTPTLIELEGVGWAEVEPGDLDDFMETPWRYFAKNRASTGQ